MKKTTERDWLLGNIVDYTKEGKKPIWEMTKEIKVKLIDWKPIIDKINFTLSKNGESVIVEIRGLNGVIYVGDEKTPILIDNECCGIKSERKNFFIDGTVRTIQVVEGVGIFKKVDGGFAMYPNWYVDFDYADIEKCLTGEEKEIWEFMGSRYEYNGRISSNLRGMVSQYKSIEE